MCSILEYVIVLLAAATGLVPAGADPDFSGSWNLQPDRSAISSLPRAPARVMNIEQQGEGYRCSLEIREHDPPALWHASTNGKDSRDPFEDGTTNTRAKWEGAALLINTIVNGRSRSYTRMDRWKLSRDRKTLMVQRNVVDLNGEVESRLVYERQ